MGKEGGSRKLLTGEGVSRVFASPGDFLLNSSKATETPIFIRFHARIFTMKRILGMLRAKFVDGFFILLPVLLAYLMLGQLFDGLMALTQPIVDVLPTSLFSDLWTHRFIAALVLLMLFILGGPAGEYPYSLSSRKLVRACRSESVSSLYNPEKPSQMDRREKCAGPTTSRPLPGHARYPDSRRDRRRTAGRRSHGLCAPRADPQASECYKSSAQARYKSSNAK